MKKLKTIIKTVFQVWQVFHLVESLILQGFCCHTLSEIIKKLGVPGVPKKLKSLSLCLDNTLQKKQE